MPKKAPVKQSSPRGPMLTTPPPLGRRARRSPHRSRGVALTSIAAMRADHNDRGVAEGLPRPAWRWRALRASPPKNARRRRQPAPSRRPAHARSSSPRTATATMPSASGTTIVSSAVGGRGEARTRVCGPRRRRALPIMWPTRKPPPPIPEPEHEHVRTDEEHDEALDDQRQVCLRDRAGRRWRRDCASKFR